jgi:hypothetical protein
MARIDLKNATIRLIDGYSNTAAVDDTPVNDDTDLDIDTVATPGIVDLGTRFTIIGSTRTYYVTDYDANEHQLVTVDATSGQFKLQFTGSVAAPISVQTTVDIAEDAAASVVQSALEGLAAIEPGDVVVTGSAGGPFTVEFTGAYANMDMDEMVGIDGTTPLGGGTGITVTTPIEGGTPHNITFTPALATADGIPADDAVITFAGRTLEVNIGSGNLTYSEKKNMLYELNRGRLDSVREGDEAPVEVSMDFIWDFITAIAGSGTPTIEDAMKNRGEAASWDSSSSDLCEPYAIDVEVEYVPPCGGVQREIITLPDFRYESLDHNITDAQVSAQGKCNVVEATVVRAA